jgi:hypothetical protein
MPLGESDDDETSLAGFQVCLEMMICLCIDLSDTCAMRNEPLRSMSMRQQGKGRGRGGDGW